MSDRRCDVLVVGAGPAGLVTAGFLGRSGHRVTVLEDHSRPVDGPLQLTPPATEVMAELGVLGPLEELPGSRRDDRLVLRGPDEQVELERCCGMLNLPRRSGLEVLRRRAVDLGVVLIPGYSAVVPLWEERRVSGVRARDAAGRGHDLAAAVVVDASGAASFLPAALGRLMPRRGSRRERVTAVVAGFRPPAPTLLLAEGGWVTLLPDGMVTAVLRHGEDACADERLRGILARAGMAGADERLRGILARAGMAGAEDPLDCVQLSDDVGTAPMATAGDGWVAVGEAAGRGAPGLPGATTAGLVVAASAAWEIDLALKRGRPFSAGQVGATLTLARQAAHLEVLLDRALNRAARVGLLGAAAASPRRRAYLADMLAGSWARSSGRLGRVLYLWWLDWRTRRHEAMRGPSDGLR